MSETTLLLLEDDDMDAQIFSDMLRRTDASLFATSFQVVRAKTLKEGLAIAATNRCDAALIDLSLPDSAGIVTFEIFTEQARTIPAVILSGHDDEVSALLAVKAGAQDYVKKHEANGPLLARAILYAMARMRTQEELERQVAERTRELSATNDRLEAEIKQRKQLEQAILEIGERERRAIGQDVHDGLNQQLAGVAYLANALHERLEEQHSVDATDAHRIVSLLKQCMSTAKTIARGLYPVPNDPDGLQYALKNLARQLEMIYPVKCQVTCVPNLNFEDHSQATQLYRIVQEATGNAVRHGGADQIGIELHTAPGSLELKITDNGTGFDPESVTKRGLGLESMAYRVDTLGGKFSILSQPGNGTSIMCQIPFAGT